MKVNLLFIYDGQCPFCNKFAELLELKSGLRNISVVNGRGNLALLNNLYEKGYDLDNGAILMKGDEILHGAKALNWICSQMEEPSDSLLYILKVIFKSRDRANITFPLLILARRITLFFIGVPRKLTSNP